MATAITDPRALFLHELRTMLWVELRLEEEVLPELRDRVRAADLTWLVERHMLETSAQARNLRRVLSILHEQDDPEESPALGGLGKEHELALQALDGPDEALADLLHANAIARTEHHEIAVYSGLVHLAAALDLDYEVVMLLRENMEQEEHALEHVERVLVKLLAEKVETAG